MDIKNIPSGNYEGYLWFSDQEKPESFCGSSLDNAFFQSIMNPFIVEGQLYCEGSKKSYSIKYVDGQHVVVQYDLAALPDDYDKKEFISQRIEGVNKLIFRQYWGATTDLFCEKMQVLEPKEFVFVGFSKVKEDKK